ncbi:hypothetical protein BY458DRAFT_563937 [Sporodiniella umbellata]|nr:hypothetical protein BY458DRAFT_563937 [Sporodiniella umbellata]
MCGKRKSLEKPISKVNPPQWLPFWKLALTYIQRNTILRLIHKRITHMQLMHSVFPTKCITELCPRCLIEPDSSEHLFFNCHLCLNYWETFIQEFLWPTPLTTIQMFVKNLTFSKIQVTALIAKILTANFDDYCTARNLESPLEGCSIGLSFHSYNNI